MKKIVLLSLVFALFAGTVNGFAQTEANNVVSFSGHFKVGRDASGFEWRTEVTVLNQTVESVGYAVSYPLPLSVKSTGGFQGTSWGTFGGLLGSDNASWTLSSDNGEYHEGSLGFNAVTIWSEQAQDFLPVYAVQIIIRKIDGNQAVLVEAHGASITSSGFGQRFLCQAINTVDPLTRVRTETGIVVRNNNSTKVKLVVELNDLFHHNTRPWIVVVVKVKPGKERTFMMSGSELFPGLNIRDGNISIKTKGSNSVLLGCIRDESGLPDKYDLPVFYGR